jgi:hypothetical protein
MAQNEAYSKDSNLRLQKMGLKWTQTWLGSVLDYYLASHFADRYTFTQHPA